VTKLVRVEETAKQLGISRTVVFGLMRDGELLSVMSGALRSASSDGDWSTPRSMG
jgi:hypothetical protein